MNPTSLARHRLHNQLIAQRPPQQVFRTPAEVVGWLGAIQGQDYPGAKWSIGLRLPGSTEATIDQALASRSVLRTWALRGTLHLVAAEDIRWLLALVAPRILTGNARRYRELELDEPALARGSEILAAALEGERELDRDDLLATLGQSGISTEGQRGVYLLQRASVEGRIVQTGARGARALFMSLDALTPPASPRPREEVLAELARRYFLSRGPATLRDFVWWSGLTTADARAGLESVEAQLVREIAGDQLTWRSPSDPPIDDLSPALLPGFDEYLIGYQDRRAVLDPRFEQRIKRGGMLAPAIVIDGRVTGTWKRAATQKKIRITTSSFTAWTDADIEAISRAARRYGDYCQLPIEVE